MPPKVAVRTPPIGYDDGGTHSIGLVREAFRERMFPLTIEGIDQAMRELVR